MGCSGAKDLKELLGLHWLDIACLGCTGLSLSGWTLDAWFVVLWLGCVELWGVRCCLTGLVWLAYLQMVVPWTRGNNGEETWEMRYCGPSPRLRAISPAAATQRRAATAAATVPRTERSHLHRNRLQTWSLQDSCKVNTFTL